MYIQLRQSGFLLRFKGSVQRFIGGEEKKNGNRLFPLRKSA